MCYCEWARRWVTEESWFDSCVAWAGFLSSSGTKQSSFLFGGYLGLKWLGREADSPPSSVVEAKNEYTHIFTPSYCFVACTETFVPDGRIMAQAVCR